MSASSRAVRLLAPAQGLVVLAGLAGAGKTELLHALADDGEQVLDLEGLASHRGSAFGGLGLPPQPPHRAFEATVRERIAAADPGRPLWTEDEGAFIGRVGLPRELQEALARAPVVEVQAPFEARVRRLAHTYAGVPPARLEAAIRRSVDRVGADAAAAAVTCVGAGDVAGAVRILLPAYDAAYRHRWARRRRRMLGTVDA